METVLLELALAGLEREVAVDQVAVGMEGDAAEVGLELVEEAAGAEGEEDAAVVVVDVEVVVVVVRLGEDMILRPLVHLFNVPFLN